MSTLDIKKHNKKTVLIYFIITILTIAVDRIYAVFGHGVASAYMSMMFLYPLVGGFVFYFLLGLIVPGANLNPGYRLFYNLYNSGIALLTVGSFIRGICEIAGTNSPYVIYYDVVGGLFLAISLILIPVIAKRRIEE